MGKLLVANIKDMIIKPNDWKPKTDLVNFSNREIEHILTEAGYSFKRKEVNNDEKRK